MGLILRTTQAHLDLVEIGLFVARQNAAAANRLLDQRTKDQVISVHS
jgi:hypothetical protein